MSMQHDDTTRSVGENPPAAQPDQASVPQRHVILHYHFFKNAGTSIDEILRKAFSKAPEVREFDRHDNVADVTKWIVEADDARAFSSHTANLPLPIINGVTVLPILFIRHPIDRARSIYEFERKQGEDTEGTVIARRTDFPGYVEERLRLVGDRQLRGFHTARLAKMFPAETGTELDRAVRAVSALPFVGLVDAFDRSLARMAHWIQSYIPDFTAEPAWENATEDRLPSLDERLAFIERELGRELYAELLEANSDDFLLYRMVETAYMDEPHHLNVATDGN